MQVATKHTAIYARTRPTLGGRQKTQNPKSEDLGLLCARGDLNPHILSDTRT